jgi:predicted peptidase
MKRIAVITGMLFITLQTAAQDLSLYRKYYFSDGERELPYRVLSPVTPARTFPLVIFLHGAIEKGNDNEAQLAIGARFFLRDSIRKNYPAFIVFPQCPADDAWAYFENRVDFTTGFAADWNFPFRKTATAVTSTLMKLIDFLSSKDSVDKKRIYIAGLSQGGMGVLDIIARDPERFAAALSICGAGDPATTRLFAGKVALWLFHGDQDKVVPPDFSRQFYKRLKRANSNVRYSEYKDVEHNSWSKAFTEPDLMKWLFSQSKN